MRAIDSRAVSRIFLLGGSEGEARVVKASTEGAKPKVECLGDLPQKMLKS
jgi:hypothetical protein